MREDRENKRIPVTVEGVKNAILSLGEELQQAEAIVIIGSLARGKITPRSDIDIMVVVKEKSPGIEMDTQWYERIRKALAKFEREVTVLVYPRKALEDISSWYVLRIAAEGIFIFDQGNITNLFRRIVEAAYKAGLVQEKLGDVYIWTCPGIKFGQIIDVKLK